jgi:hypothetical protein
LFAAVEVKSSAKARPEDERGLRAFLTDYPEAKGMVVYRGTRRLNRSGIVWLPAEEFLMRSADPGELFRPW